ncbi:MAG: phage holin family protein [Roseobacter sp.]|uniref:phage holin family protein n=1 Tax=Tateyamaria sp. TaxID=1929288 RepID=UPI00327E931A
MIKNLVHIFLQAQAGSVRRKAKGAILEAAALGMIGLSVTLFFLGSFLWLSVQMEPWMAAVFLGILALLAGIILMLVGRSVFRRKEADPHEQAMSVVKGLGLLSEDGQTSLGKAETEQESGPIMVASALAAGLILGRSINR